MPARCGCALGGLGRGVSGAQSALPSVPTTAKAIFAGGCFWSVEFDFDKVPGVLSTTSGDTGGTVANPSDEQVSGKTTGHAEAVEVVFDPALPYRHFRAGRGATAGGAGVTRGA